MGVSVGMPDVSREVMTTSSGLLPLLFGRCSGDMAYALLTPGEFSLRNEGGNRDLGVSFGGEPNLPLPPFEDGVDGIGEFGNDFSSMYLCVTGGGGRRTAGGDQAGDFCPGESKVGKSESELRRFFLGSPFGMKLGCSPIVDSPRFS